jgi:hypothetical protein
MEPWRHHHLSFALVVYALLLLAQAQNANRLLLTLRLPQSTVPLYQLPVQLFALPVYALLWRAQDLNASHQLQLQ